MLGKADIPTLNKNQHDLISLVLTFNRYLLGGISLNNEWFCEIKVSSDTLKLSQIIISFISGNNGKNDVFLHPYPSQHLPAQNQQHKHQINVWNMF